MKKRASIYCKILFRITIMNLVCLLIMPLAALSQNTARIHGRAAVIMKSGDVKPVAKRDFVLLPFSLYDLNMTILKEVDNIFGPQPRAGSKKWDSYVKKSSEYRDKRTLEELQKAKNQEKYVEFRTDFDGSYEVSVPAGQWYVCNQYRKNNYAVEIGRAAIIWAVPITVKPGQVLKLDLENSNAAGILNID